MSTVQVQPKQTMVAGSVKPAILNNEEEANPLNHKMKGSAAAAAAALKAAERHASFVQHHPSAAVHNKDSLHAHSLIHFSLNKELHHGTFIQKAKHQDPPMSPAVSVVSTHCGGSPMAQEKTRRTSSTMSAFELNGTSSSLSLSHLEECISEASDSEQLAPGLKTASRVSVGSIPGAAKTPGANVNKPLIKAPVHCPKMKGEAQPLGVQRERDMHQMHTVCEKTLKIIDEAHHFGLCDHYAKLLDQAKEVGFANIKWPTNFTMFHLAAKKNNKEFIEWLVRNDFDDLHTIDDFGKKPIDYACPKKRDSVHEMLSAMMLHMKAPLTAQEIKYQQIKAGTWVDPAKIAKQEAKKTNCMTTILQSAEIAEGDTGVKNKPSDMMSAFEAEQVVPAEYKKCFKKMGNGGGWAAMEGAWPNQGTSVLHWAARNGKEDLCHFLVLEFGADPKEEDGSGHDAIYHAKLKRHRKLAKKLLLNFKEPKMMKGKKK